MKTITKFLIEATVDSSLDEYYAALSDSYIKKFTNPDDVETFIEFLKMNDEQMSEMFGVEINVEKEDSGTLLVSYAESDDMF